MRCFALDRSKPTEKHEGEGYRECPIVLTNWRCWWILESHNVWKHIFWITRPGQPWGGILMGESIEIIIFSGSLQNCTIAMFERYSTMKVTAGMRIVWIVWSIFSQADHPAAQLPNGPIAQRGRRGDGAQGRHGNFSVITYQKCPLCMRGFLGTL